MRRATPFLLIADYFLWFAFDGTRAGWMEDDPMNLYMYWKPGLAAVFQYNLTFWTGFYRPLGGLFYLPIYAAAHLNPALPLGPIRPPRAQHDPRLQARPPPQRQ